MLCPICNRTIASGDFCDDLQCPNPIRDGAEGAGDEYCHNEGAAFCTICGLARLGRVVPDKAPPPKPAPDAMREALSALEPFTKLGGGQNPRDAAAGLHYATYYDLPGDTVVYENSGACITADEARKFDQRAHRAKTIATSIRSLIPPYATPPVRGDREAIEPILNFARAIPDNVDDATGIAYAPFAKAMGVAASLTAGQFRRLLSLPVQAGAGEREVADQIIGDIERRFPDWKSYRDLVDCIDITLHNLRRGQQ